MDKVLTMLIDPKFSDQLIKFRKLSERSVKQDVFNRQMYGILSEITERYFSEE